MQVQSIMSSEENNTSVTQNLTPKLVPPYQKIIYRCPQNSKTSESRKQRKEFIVSDTMKKSVLFQKKQNDLINKQ